jgi:hypothetical protein
LSAHQTDVQATEKAITITQNPADNAIIDQQSTQNSNNLTSVAATITNERKHKLEIVSAGNEQDIFKNNDTDQISNGCHITNGNLSEPLCIF